MKKVFIILVLSVLFSVNAMAQTPIISTFAGNGTPGFSGDGGAATSAQLYGPSGVATGADGSIYIADYGNNIVRKVSPDGTISTFAGQVGMGGYSGDGGPAATANLGNPSGVAIDGAGNVYILDGDYQVIRMVNTSGIISTVAGNTSGGDVIPDGAYATSGSVSATAMAVDATGNIYITDYYSRVREVYTTGIIETIAGIYSNAAYNGDGGSATSAGIGYPSGLAVDGSGNIYIADEGNEVIRKVDASGIISTYAGSGSYGFSGDGGPATAAKFNFYGNNNLAVDGAGDLFVSDAGNYRVREINTAGTISTFAGDSVSGYSGDGGPANHAELGQPAGVAVDASGTVYIADIYYSTSVVRRVGPCPPSGGTISGPATVTAGGTIALTDNIPGGVWSSSNGRDSYHRQHGCGNRCIGRVRYYYLYNNA